MRVLICGGRNYNNLDRIVLALSALKDVTLVIDGACRTGADLRGHLAAKALKIPTQRFPANWTLYGKAAGPIRNQQMIDEGRPDLVLAFPDEDSIGTWDMVQRAKAAGIRVVVFGDHVA